MKTGRTTRFIVARLKNKIKDMTGFGDACNTSEDQEVLNLKEKLEGNLTTTDSFILARCLEQAIHVMQFVEGKENLFALGKVFLCALFLGGT